MKRRRLTPEQQLQETLVSFLRFSARRGVMWLSIPNELPAIEARAERFLATGMKPGAGDLELIIDGRAHFLELKSKDGRQTFDQKRFELECELNGVPYALARSFDEARTIFEGWGALKSVAGVRRAA